MDLLHVGLVADFERIVADFEDKILRGFAKIVRCWTRHFDCFASVLGRTAADYLGLPTPKNEYNSVEPVAVARFRTPAAW